MIGGSICSDNHIRKGMAMEQTLLQLTFSEINAELERNGEKKKITVLESDKH